MGVGKAVDWVLGHMLFFLGACMLSFFLAGNTTASLYVLRYLVDH